MNSKTSYGIIFVVIVAIGLSGSTVWSDMTTNVVDVYFDLVLDESRRRLYGSDMNNGTIQVIDQDTRQIIDTLELGDQPAGIDIDPTDSELAVAMSGEGKILFVDLDTLMIITHTVPSVSFGPNIPYDVLYGRPGRLYSAGNPGSSGSDCVHVFDTSTREELGCSNRSVTGAPRLDISADHNILYTGESAYSPDSIYRFDISTDSPIFLSEEPHGSVRVNALCILADGRIVTAGGQILPADLSSVEATFPYGGHEIECNDDLERVFILDFAARLLRVFDLPTYSQLTALSMDNFLGAAVQDETGHHLYVSTDDGVKVFGTDFRPRAYLPHVSNHSCPDFFDDFSDTASGWVEEDVEYFSFGYLNGEYQIVTRKGSLTYLVNSPSCPREDYVVEVDARWVGDPGSEYGVVFGVVGDFYDFYLFLVDAELQTYRLLYRGPRGWENLIYPTSTSAIFSGNATNHFRVERSGSEIILEVNGSQLAGLHDSRITGLTGAGLAVLQTYIEMPNSDSRFDNFSMRTVAPN